MIRRTVLLPAVVAAAVLAACLAAVLAVSTKAEAAFPSQSGRIAFSSSRPNPECCGRGPQQIFTIRADGSGTKQLTDTSGFYDDNENPAFSPDGTKIAWTKGSSGGDEVWVMNRDGTGKRMLIANASQPAWSPDGTKIAFSRRDPEQRDSELYWRALDGKRARQVTDNAHYEGGPAWSPDGKKIAFSRTEWLTFLPNCPEGCSGDSDIFTIRPDGTGARRVTDLPSQTDAYRPNWAPKGGALVLMTNDYGDDEGDDIDVVKVKPDGTPLGSFPLGLGGGIPAVFSPDGQKLAFIRSRVSASPSGGVVISNRDGTGQEAVTDYAFEGPSVYDLDWGPRPTTAP